MQVKRSNLFKPSGPRVRSAGLAVTDPTGAVVLKKEHREPEVPLE